MNSDNFSTSEFNPNSAKQIQGLADLLTNILITENKEETEVSLLNKTTNSPKTTSQENSSPKIIVTEEESNFESDDNQETEIIDISSDNTEGFSRNSSSLKVQKSHPSQYLSSSSQSQDNNNVFFVKPEPKFNAKNNILEIEIESLRNILVGLESRIYDHQELINLLLPAVTETIRDKINQREGAITNLFKPGEGKTISEQIEHETELLMNALYPVIGGTIGDYIATTIRKINSKVADALDNADTGNQDLKIKTITPEELQNQKSNYFRVENVFLIHKKSHLIIAEKQSIIHHNLPHEVITSMLASVRNLSYKFTDNSQFLSVEYGRNQINVYAGNNAYLAVISEGIAPTKFLQLLAQTLDVLETEYETCIKLFQGDRTIIPDSLITKLQKILEFEIYREIKQRNRWLVGGCLISLLLITVPYSIHKYFQYKNLVIAQNILEKIEEDDELAVYNLDVEVKNKQINLTGKLPNNNLKEKLNSVAQENKSKLPINNQVVIVDLPVNEVEIKAETEQVLRALNQIDGIDISTKFNNGILTLTGEALPLTDLAKITQSFYQIKGIDKVDNQITIKPLQIPTRIYFSPNSANVSARDIEGKLGQIKEQMQKYPQIQLTITGYRSSQENYNLGLKRAENIQTILEDLGIDRRRLIIEDGKQSPPDVQNNSEQWLSRAVIFELQ